MSTAVPPAPTQFETSTARAPRGWRADWAESFGRSWPLDLAIMGIVVFCFGAVQPLADPDLPMHLSVGEWIVRHHGVPHMEPFAWTRPGEPYYAYSWLPQTLYFVVLRSFGHLGLRALQGILVGSSAMAVLVLARAARWRASQAVILAGANLIVGSMFVGFLRPQSVLLITMPLSWAGAFLIIRGRVAAAAAVLFLASALTANSHLFFLLTLAPIALLWTEAGKGTRARDAFIGLASVVLGWFTSPYSLEWIALFKHNFGASLLVRPPSAVTELQPGFVAALHPPHPVLLLVVGMLAIPWLLARAGLRRREQLLAAVYWSIGVILFGYATRLFIAWWVLAMVPAGWALAYLTRGAEEGPPRARFRVLLLVAAGVIVATQLTKTRALWALEGDSARRTLPTVNARPAEQLATWLSAHTLTGSRGRIATTFSFGSYLTWRLPGYSASIDSRGIFPDSVAGAEAVVLAFERDVPLGPWRSADLAIIPYRYRVAGVLDTASGWRRLAATRDEAVPTDSVGLWVANGWWLRNRRDGDAVQAR